MLVFSSSKQQVDDAAGEPYITKSSALIYAFVYPLLALTFVCSGRGSHCLLLLLLLLLASPPSSLCRRRAIYATLHSLSQENASTNTHTPVERQRHRRRRRRLCAKICARAIATLVRPQQPLRLGLRRNDCRNDFHLGKHLPVRKTLRTHTQTTQTSNRRSSTH